MVMRNRLMIAAVTLAVSALLVGCGGDSGQSRQTASERIAAEEAAQTQRTDDGRELIVEPVATELTVGDTMEVAVSVRDDDEIKARQLIEQVTDMVNTSPDESIRLVKRWLDE